MIKQLTSLALAAALTMAAQASADGGLRTAQGSERSGGDRTTLVAQNAVTPPGSPRAGEVSREQLRAEGRNFLAANAKQEGVITLPSGVQYRVVSEGQGATPKPGDTVVVQYQGKLIDGSVFGSSGEGGKSEKFAVDRLVPGLAEALKLMKEGSHWIVYLPAALAFGERGPLEERVVIYDITLLSVEPQPKQP
ncbi:MAG TPA: FKBP-type peptidyl-prolyl cis-trans isomerase [bacterium]